MFPEWIFHGAAEIADILAEIDGILAEIVLA